MQHTILLKNFLSVFLCVLNYLNETQTQVLLLKFEKKFQWKLRSLSKQKFFHILSVLKKMFELNIREKNVTFCMAKYDSLKHCFFQNLPHKKFNKKA